MRAGHSKGGPMDLMQLVLASYNAGEGGARSTL
jgi:hypothetical protein